LEANKVEISAARRVVVKVGTSTLTHQNGRLNMAVIRTLVDQLSRLHDEGRDVVLVTSGAVGAGMGRLGLTQRPTDIMGKQALAAVGQGLLMQRYEGLFGRSGKVVGQVLLTRLDFEDPNRSASASATLEQLFRWRVIPIVNENDTVTAEEIRVGDNDTLSARVAVLCKADGLILLSDVDGFYPADPRTSPGLEPLPRVNLMENWEHAASGAGTATGTGGMVTKLHAARICMQASIPVVLARGARPGVIREIMAGASIGTLFEGVS
jgi:glutamate 5-kinase